MVALFSVKAANIPSFGILQIAEHLLSPDIRKSMIFWQRKFVETLKLMNPDKHSKTIFSKISLNTQKYH